jgi:hypothetical protein
MNSPLDKSVPQGSANYAASEFLMDLSKPNQQSEAKTQHQAFN